MLLGGGDGLLGFGEVGLGGRGATECVLFG